jgi:hypothetical protein
LQGACCEKKIDAKPFSKSARFFAGVLGGAGLTQVEL